METECNYMLELTAKSCPNEALALSNCVVLNQADFVRIKQSKYVELSTYGRKTYRFTTIPSSAVGSGCIGFSSFQVCITTNFRIHYCLNAQNLWFSL
ncbi:hypothetical protein GJ496_001847 [Pomphorhynchus laevis]|nr:hypothetical protein GJ496_001847 [Pomphorhynchus laevis]